MAVDFALSIARFDEMIRAGQGAAVRLELNRIRSADIDRRCVADLASIARRVGLTDFALKALRPIVHPQVPLASPATTKEIAIYASALSRIGAIDEALALLNEVRNDPTPEVLLYTSFAHIFRWDYACAIPFLRKYIVHPSVSEYEAMIGKLNLAGAYQFTGEHEEQNLLLEEVLDQCRLNNWQTLYKNALELSAQSAIIQLDLPRADVLLAEASSLSASNSQTDFLIRKWRLIASLKSVGLNKETLEESALIRSEAQRIGDFETMRECDYYLALACEDPERNDFVYFGTPHASYKRRILSETSQWYRPRSTYTWQLRETPAERTFDLKRGLELDSTIALKCNQSLHRLFLALCMDFYRPHQIGSLFGRLFAGEYFDPVHSPERLRRLVERLRQWFSENQIPLQIKKQGATYSLKGITSYALLLSGDFKPETAADRNETHLKLLKNEWPYESFTAREAATQLNIPRHQAQVLLKWALSKKRAYASGQARAKRYRLAK